MSVYVYEYLLTHAEGQTRFLQAFARNSTKNSTRNAMDDASGY